MLVEALPDTLELLLRACMEGLSIAGERAKKEASIVAAAVDAASGPTSDNGYQNPSSSRSRSPAVVSELELARAVMSDAVYLAQLAPECFHEVVARVARKVEPERYALLFPLHLVGGDGGHGDARVEAAAAAAAVSSAAPAGGVVSERVGARRAEEVRGGDGAGVGPRWGRWVHPTHLFHECVLAGKLTTAAWYLPLIRDDVAYGAAQR